VCSDVNAFTPYGTHGNHGFSRALPKLKIL
jgi:hypothetical protein